MTNTQTDITPEQRQQVIDILQSSFDALPEEQKDVIFVSCACGEDHHYSYRTLLEAIKDPNNQDGNEFLRGFLAGMQVEGQQAN